MEMMSTPFVTVVMPVYNAASSLGKAIKSLQNQTYEDWELICVNDGSTDTSLEMLNCFASIDRRIKVLSQENGGVAAARKTAYLALESPYAINLDADDEFSPDLLEKCVTKAKETSADIIVPNCICETSRTTSFDWNKAYGYTEETVMTGMEAFSRTFIPATMHGYLMWRSELLKKHACGEDPVLLKTFSEDEYYRRVLFLNSRDVVFCGGYYIYKNNSESITKKFNPKQIGYLTTARQMVDLIDEYDIPVETQKIIKENYLRTAISLQIKYYAFKIRMNSDNRNKVRKAVRNAYDDAVKYKKDIRFADKGHSWVYRLVSLNGYFLFCLSSYLMYLKKYA